MNTILQKRIEEKSKELAQKYFPNEMNIWAQPNYEAQYVESACKEIATFSLQNQWISVEEDLPERLENENVSDYVFVSNKNWVDVFRYDFKNNNWLDYVNHTHWGITHWMPIPSLEGGEK